MNNTTKMTKNMKPAIVFNTYYGWNLIFVDAKNKTWLKSDIATAAWMKSNVIAMPEALEYIWSEYNNMKDYNVKSGLISYFSKDEEEIYCLSKTIDVDKLFDEAFNM